MNIITEKIVERALRVHSQEISLPTSDDQSEYDFEFNAMRAALEAAFAVAELEEAQNLRRIVGDPRMRVGVPIAAADKESEVMPSAVHKGRSYKHSARHATSPGGAIAGASGLEPLDEIDPVASAELQQRADAALGDKSRWKIIDRAPSPDEVSKIIDQIPLRPITRKRLLDDAIESAVIAERERCAKIAETLKTPSNEYDNGEIFFYGAFAQMHAKAIAAAIRAVPPQQEEGE